MPIKEYQCNTNGCEKFEQRFEVFHRTQAEVEKAKEFTSCAYCGIVAEPVMSVTGTPQFKGSGFYQTDYK